ncbi:MAG: nuclear transport factor 2 family protein [Alphaproteobacteria bacterium]|nr:nuclear transport factor 2 family protein [Alphaproteobacteria bacterium]
MDIEAELRDLAARRDIQQAVMDYMRGQDRLLPDVQRRAFHDDAFVDAGLFSGGPDAYVAFAQTFLSACKASQHLVGQMDIRVEGDTATGEVYFLAWHRIVEDGEDKDLIVAGRYVDEYENRAGAWKIARRREIVDWARTDAPADDFLRGQPSLHRGGRGTADFGVSRDWPLPPRT